MAVLLAGPSTPATPAMSLEPRRKNRDQLPHDNYGPSLNAGVWLLTATAAVFLVLRLYCKFLRRKSLWWDDYVLLASFACLVGQTSLLSVWVSYGFGKHIWDITDFYNYLLVANVTGVVSITGAAWSKTSFALTLLRVSNGWIRRLVWFVIITVNLFLGLSALFTFAQCRPVAKLWDNKLEGVCWDKSIVPKYNTFASVYSGVMDIALAALPWWIINRRSLSNKERFGVLIAMSMGVFAGIASIAKTATLWAVTDPDTIHTVTLMIMATAEIAITIVAASIPVLRALVKDKRALNSAAPRFYRYYISRHGKDSSIGTASTGTATTSTTAKVPPSPYSAAIVSPLSVLTRNNKGFFEESYQLQSPKGAHKSWRPDPPAKDSWMGSPTVFEMQLREQGRRGSEGSWVKKDWASDRKGSLPG